MTGMGSIRARLTVAITALTALAAVASVWFGLAALDDLVRQQAIDGRLNEAAVFDLGLFGGGRAELEVEEITLALRALADVDLLDDLVDNFGQPAQTVTDSLGSGNTLLILLEEGTVADVRVDLNGNAQVLQVLELDELPEDVILVPRSDLLELSAVTDELFDFSDSTMDFEDELANLGEDLEDLTDDVEDPEDLEDFEEDIQDLQDELEDLEVIDDLKEVYLEPVSAPDAERSLEYLIVDVGEVNLGLVVDLTDERAALAAIRRPLWIAAAALTVLAGVATWLLTGRALRPVAAITSEVEAINSGTLDGRVPEPPNNDEIGVLARTMNRMLGRLEDGDRQRRQFVSDASHELRTPLAVLRNEAEVAQRSPASTSVDQLASVVLGESKRLEGLVEDLLTLARSDESRAAASGDHRQSSQRAGFVELDLDDLLLIEAARTRRLPVDRHAVSAGRVLGRPDDLSRVFAHLIDNAARHGRSQIAVGLHTDPSGAVLVWVDDDGAGVPEAERSRIFERFVRLDEARSRDQGGAGLGLAVVADVIAAHGGTVTVTDSPIGGARFVAEFRSHKPDVD